MHTLYACIGVKSSSFYGTIHSGAEQYSRVQFALLSALLITLVLPRIPPYARSDFCILRAFVVEFAADLHHTEDMDIEGIRVIEERSRNLVGSFAVLTTPAQRRRLLVKRTSGAFCCHMGCQCEIMYSKLRHSSRAHGQNSFW